jgi:hydrogenase maturation protein HypF
MLPVSGSILLNGRIIQILAIVHSHQDGERSLLISPDFALCPACRSDIHQTDNRRYRYAFTTCTLCGPRLSIITQLPYDRPHTSMETYKMCDSCQSEYDNPKDRRYYSQTNSCEQCGIQLALYDQQQKLVSHHQETIFNEVVKAWKDDQIVAIKGIGGYLLCCNANSNTAVKKLRERKRRPTKPFALMFPNLESITMVAEIDQAAQNALQSEVAPIVLLPLKETAHQTIVHPTIAPGLNQIGVMLPYTPLYELLLQSFGQPIVASSGNISQSPIIYEDEKALQELSQIADLILINDRDIVIPQDDSVLTFSPMYKHPILLRRSRGLAPSYIPPSPLPDQYILAMGAMLKSTFALLHKQNIYLSQYLGDLEHYDTQLHFEHTLDHFSQLLDTQPELIVVDKHPAYPSTLLGQEIAQQRDCSIISIQHHIAHFGAILGEHDLLEGTEPILGCIWDGTGLGDDQQIWGGEFFVYHDHQFERKLHLSYFDAILGDKMPKEPRLSALSACNGIAPAIPLLEDKFSKTEWQIYQRLLSKEGNIQTSSIGRLFDAVASLVGLADKQSFEGEAAMLLEQQARTYCTDLYRIQQLDTYWSAADIVDKLPTTLLLHRIIDDISKGVAVSKIAATFHNSLAMAIGHIAEQLNLHKIAFSGGVFQNSLLVDLIIHHYHNKYDLYFHKQLSPNDENISFGQLMLAKSNDYVFSNSRKSTIHSGAI